MTTEVWFRNPADYLREVVEVGHLYFAWDRGYVWKRNLDVKKYVELQVPEPLTYRMLVIGEQGTAEITRDTTLQRPAAVYPTWCYGDDAALLEELIFQPVGEDKEVCEDLSVPVEVRPVLGQEHRVVVTDIPHVGSGPGRKFVRYLAQLQEEAPGCIVHVHGLYSFRVNFGLGFRAADVDSRTLAQKGQIMLPMGKEIKYEQAANNMQWVRLLGFQYADLEVPRNRCMYNMKSAMWAGANWDRDTDFRTIKTPKHKPDLTSPSALTPQTVSRQSLSGKAKSGDMFTCDTCSLTDECKYYRKGAVCTVPRSEGKKIADMFRSRDAEQIIDALGSVIAKQADRVEDGLDMEDIEGEPSPEVSKMMNDLFKNGVQLAKLLKPDLNGKGQSVNVNVGGGHTVGVSSAQQLTARIFAELEAQGIPRSQITPDMVANVLDPNRDVAQPAMIEAQVVKDEQDD